MRVINMSEVPTEDASNNAIFYGGAVSRQDIVSDQTSEFFNFSIVNFDAGARNRFHTHTSDQILIVTQGNGIVATENEERVVGEGTTVHISAGEKHWHGATDESQFSHITITAVGSVTEIST